MAENISFARIGYVDESGNFVPKNVRAQDVYASNGKSAEEHITNAAVHLTTEQAAKIDSAVQSDKLGAANGAATLDANGKLAVNQIPEQLLGKVAYKGTFDPTTGLDDSGNELPAPAKANLGWYWIASADGKYTPPGSTEQIDFTVGDWVISNGTKYGEVDNSTADPVARQSAATAQTAAESAQTTATAAQSAAETAQTAAEAAQTTANTANTNALKLDAAHATSEENMKTLNLRPGAIVFMDVTNEAPTSEESV